MHPLEIVGISHVVIGVPVVERVEHDLVAYGYARHGSIDGGENPSAKAPFVAGPLARGFSMRLLVSALASPPVELLKEDDGESVPFDVAPSEAVLAEAPRPPLSQVLRALDSPHAVIAPGLRTLTPKARPQGVAAVIVRSGDVAATLALWRVLGLEPVAVGSEFFTAAVGGATASSRMDLYVRRGVPGRGYLNQVGLVCLSFWCRNLDRLQTRLGHMGCDLSEPFSIDPFGRPLRGVFARAAGGEIYEFLVPERVRKVMAK